MADVKVEQWADGVIRDAMKIMNCGFDENVAGRAVSDALEALANQANLLKDQSVKMKAKGDSLEMKLVANAMMSTSRVVDSILRLSKFMDGQPDSRPQIDGSVLSGLTDRQLETVYGWVKENERQKRGA